MITRTTIKLDTRFPERAKRALGTPTTRATVEEALQRAADHAENEHEEQAVRQLEYFRSLATRVDLDVLASDEMWR
jgi:Arc/MetJ family transcription regulator